MLGEPFIFLRPIYYLLVILIICNLVYIAWLRNKIKANMYVFFNSFFIVMISAVLLFQSGIIVDALSMSGDALIFGLTIFIAFIFVLTFFLYPMKKRD